MSRFFSFTCHRISLFPVPAYKWQPRPRMVKILTGECWNVCKEKFNPFFLFFCCFSWQTAFWWIALHCDPRRKNPGTVWCNLQVYLQERRWCMNKSCSSVHWLNSIQKKVPRVNWGKGLGKFIGGGLLQRGFYSFYLKTFVGLTLFYERISVSFLMMDFLSHVTYHAHFLLACK